MPSRTFTRRLVDQMIWANDIKVYKKPNAFYWPSRLGEDAQISIRSNVALILFLKICASYHSPRKC